MVNGSVIAKIQKNKIHAKKNYIWNPTTCNCGNFEYLISAIDNSVITCNEIINGSANFYKKVRY